MKEYIDREAALACVCEDCSGQNGCNVPCVDYVRIKSLPAADVVEARHGANIGEDYDAVDQFVCSECGIELQGWYRVERDMDDGDETHHVYAFRYCPNCGARIDMEEDE